MKKTIAILNLFLLLLISSCSKDDTAEPNNETDNIYVLNNEVKNDEAVTMKLWKNGVSSDLNNENSFGEKLFIKNSDSYVLGFKYNQLTESNEQKLWKNGQEIKTPKNIDILDFFISNNDTYIIGKEVSTTSGSKPKLILFKNNQATYLTDGNSENPKAFRIFVEKTTVYVLGIINEEGKNILRLWKNEEVTNLTDGTNNVILIDFFVENDNTYVVANESTTASGATDPSTKYIPKLWINNKKRNLTDNETFYPYKLFVENGNIYTIGGNEKSEIQLLTNNKTTTITSNASHAIEASNLFVKNSKVYITFSEKNQDDIDTSKLWIDGNITDLSDGKIHTYPTSVFVE